MIEKIAFKDIPLLSKSAKELVYSPETLNDFISSAPTISNFESIIKNRLPVNREVLVNELLKQNKNSHLRSIENINKLANQNTYTVATGHQICLFTGPLYSIYKIVSIINLAKELENKYPKTQIVPVFWMATEDHDFEEINHVNLRGKKITWNSKQTGPVGRFSTTEMTAFLKQITKEISSDLAKTLCSFYSDSPNLTIAHNKMINHLFGEYGVVVLDADTRELKREMKEIFTSELLNNKTFDAVEKTSAELEKRGYKKQVTPREINLFYQENGLRERIILEDNLYTVLNTELSFTEKEILEELESYPEKFSPNVVMRPIYQEKILPNLVYIGGPGELAYWLQLKSSFEVNGLQFPILVLRNMCLLVKENIQRKIDKLPFTIGEYFEREDDLISKYVKKESEISFEDEILEIEKIFELTKEKAMQIDFTLERTVIAELKRAQNSFNKIEKKVTKADKRNHKVAVNQIKSIKQAFFPNNSFQERHNNLLEFYSEDFIKNLVNNLKSLEDNLTLMQI